MILQLIEDRSRFSRNQDFPIFASGTDLAGWSADNFGRISPIFRSIYLRNYWELAKTVETCKNYVILLRLAVFSSPNSEFGKAREIL